MKCLKDSMFLLNLLPYDVKFNIDGKKGYNTIFSLITSILIIAFQIYLASYFSTDLIYQTNPRLNYKELEFSEIKQSNLTEFINSVFFEFDVLCTMKEKNLDLKKYLESKNLTINDIFKMRISLSDIMIEEIDGIFYREPYEVSYLFDLTYDFPYKFDNDHLTVSGLMNKDSKFNLNLTDYYFEGLNLTSKKTTLYKNINWDNVTISIDKKTKIKMSFEFNDLNGIVKYTIKHMFRSFTFKDYILDVDNKQFFRDYNYKWEKAGSTVNYGSNILSLLTNYEWYDIIDDHGFIFKDLSSARSPRKKFVGVEYPLFEPNEMIPLCEIEFS